MAAKPTIFVSVPRLFNRFYQVMSGRIAEMKGCKKKLVSGGIQTK